LAYGVAHGEHGRDRDPLAGGDNLVSIATAGIEMEFVQRMERNAA
jgi:hypothetical protein